MKKLLIILAAAFAIAAFQGKASAATETYFPYPAVPDSMSTLQQRCDYLVHHFWDFCDLKKSFSSKQKMEQAFADYISFMPYASRDSVDASLKVFFKKLEKQPADLLFITECAENQLMGDSAQFKSEELYLFFLQAVTANKKVNKTAKARYEYQLKILGATQPGMTAPELDYVDRFDRQFKLSADTADIVILFFSDPSCDECRSARVRLDASIKANYMINRRIMKVVCITPDECTQEWKEAVADYSPIWTVGAAPEVDTIYDIQQYPSFYILDADHKIVAKNFNINQVLQVLDRL